MGDHRSSYPEDYARARERYEVKKTWAKKEHSDPYCVDHCRVGVKHSQCGCTCDHQKPETETT